MQIAWGWKRPDGSFVIDSSIKDEQSAWHLALGWPDEDEIEEARKAGWIVRRFSVSPSGDGERIR